MGREGRQCPREGTKRKWNSHCLQKIVEQRMTCSPENIMARGGQRVLSTCWTYRGGGRTPQVRTEPAAQVRRAWRGVWAGGPRQDVQQAGQLPPALVKLRLPSSFDSHEVEKESLSQKEHRHPRTTPVRDPSFRSA